MFFEGYEKKNISLGESVQEPASWTQHCCGKVRKYKEIRYRVKGKKGNKRLHSKDENGMDEERGKNEGRGRDSNI